MSLHDINKKKSTSYISIIMPVYNNEKYLSAALDDLQRQTYTNFELICVDDGSVDESLSIIKKYADGDERIKSIVLAHAGGGAARNAGLKVATGEYVLFLDSDDRFDCRLLELTLNEAERLKTDVLLFDVACFNDADGRDLFSFWFIRRHKLPKKEVFSYKDCPNTIFDLSYSVAWNKLIRRNLIAENNFAFQNTPYGNDILFVQSVMLAAKRIAFFDRKLIRYRQNHNTALTAAENRSKDPLCLCRVIRDWRSSLESSGLFNEVAPSFVSYAALSMTGGLESLNVNGFFVMYDTAKSLLFDELNIANFNHDEIMDESLAKKIETMSRCDAQEYLHFIMKFYQSETMRLLTDVNNLWQEKVNLTNRAKRKHWVLEHNGKIKRGDKVIIYGAGDVGKDYFSQLSREGCVITAWVDSKYESFAGSERLIEPPTVIGNRECDFLVVAINRPQIRQEIIEKISSIVSKDKII